MWKSSREFPFQYLYILDFYLNFHLRLYKNISYSSEQRHIANKTKYHCCLIRRVTAVRLPPATAVPPPEIGVLRRVSGPQKSNNRYPEN